MIWLAMISLAVGIRVGYDKKKKWEYKEPKDRFVSYYVQKSQGIKYIVVRDDVMGKEYLVVKGVGIISIDKGVKK
jgi:hypothetical protein